MSGVLLVGFSPSLQKIYEKVKGPGAAEETADVAARTFRQW